MFHKTIISTGMLVSLFCGARKIEHKSTRLKPEYNFSTVDTLVQKNLPAYSNHVAVLIAQNGKIIYSKQAGLDINTAIPIASSSKWLSAGVIMALVDEHKLSLDDTVGKFLPIFTRYHKGGITIRQLFSHTSGFEGLNGNKGKSSKFEHQANLTLQQAVDSIAVHDPLLNQPGTTFNYGGVSMQIGGRIAEIVSGKTWQQLFDEKIGKPCNMQAAYKSMSTQNPLIAGGASTSASSYLNFLIMIANRGVFNGTRVLSENAIATMLSVQSGNAQIQYTPYPFNPYSTHPSQPVRYGIGNWCDVTADNGNVLENSSPGLFGAHPWVDQKHHLAGIILTMTAFKKSNLASLQIRQAVRNIVDKGD